jgi:hypothetical protein
MPGTGHSILGRHAGGEGFLGKIGWMGLHGEWRFVYYVQNSVQTYCMQGVER